MYKGSAGESRKGTRRRRENESRTKMNEKVDKIQIQERRKRCEQESGRIELEK